MTNDTPLARIEETLAGRILEAAQVPAGLERDEALRTLALAVAAVGRAKVALVDLHAAA